MTSKAAVALRALLNPKQRPSQAWLARELGVSQQAVSSWVNGDATPSPEKLARIEDLTGIPMRDWTEGADPDPASAEPAKNGTEG